MNTPTRLRLLALLACLPGSALAADQAGVSAAVRGEVTLARAQSVGRAVLSGDAIFLQDKIRSGPRSGMQILLLDQTTFTIGPDSEIAVDEFVYDPQTGAGRLGARVAKGVFRFVSGKIAKEDPSNMNVALPAGNIGIRGTMAAGTADPVTRASLVVLLGEGADNASGEPAGSIDVCNAGACTHVSRAGFGVRIDGVEARPSPAFRIGDDAVDSILRAVTGPSDGFDRATAETRDEAVNADLASDDNGDAGKREAREIKKRLASLDEADALTDLAAQDATSNPQNQGVVFPDRPTLADGPTLYDQLRSIAQGQIHYAQYGVPLSSGGNYDLSLDVDFGAQTYGGGSSMFQVNGSRTGFQQLNVAQSYSSLQGQSLFTFNTSAITGPGCGTNCTATLNVLPQNVGGKIAGEALHNITVKDLGGVPIDTGAGKAPGLPGLTP